MWILGRGDLVGGRYRIERELGAGGMAHVYAARDEDLGDPVALKIIRPDLVEDAELAERFKREVRIARQVNHPNVVRIFEFGRAEVGGKEVLFMTMELLTGMDLARWSKARGASFFEEALGLVLQICDGLEAAHRAGVIHRDIKPHNVFVDDTGRVRVMDFGISRLRNLDGLTRGSQSMGTPHYMSPEQVTADKQIDHRSDIYSVGVLLFELSTGTLPFRGNTPVEVAVRHLEEPPVPPSRINPRLPKELDRIVLTCLEKDPAKRYPSVAELRSDLRRLSAGLDRETLPATLFDAGPRQAHEPAPSSTEVASSRPNENVTTRRRPRIRVRAPLALYGAGLGLAAIALVLYSLRPSRPLVEDASEISAERAEPFEEVVITPPEDPPQAALRESPSPPSPAPREAPPVAAPVPPVPRAPLPIRISANPGTEIFLDGDHVGTVPPVVDVAVAPGHHKILYRIPDYEEHEAEIEVRQGAANEFSHRFPAYGVLRVVSQPYAIARLDGRELGYTPVNLAKVREGEHRLVLEREGYRTVETVVVVKPGELNLFRFDLERWRETP